MPDYSACDQGACERRHGCARYLMRYGAWQSVMTERPATCTHFWDAKDTPFAMLTPEQADARLLKRDSLADEGSTTAGDTEGVEP